MSSLDPSPEEFRAWAYDPEAYLSDQDEDLLLLRADFLPLLVEAAADPACPKAYYCATILEHFAQLAVGFGRREDEPALREAAARAARLEAPRARDWAAYVARLFGYRERKGPVGRAEPEAMARDLLSGPLALAGLERIGRKDWITVRLAMPDTHWEAFTAAPYPEFLYVNRATGAFRRHKFNALSPAELSRIR